MSEFDRRIFLTIDEWNKPRIKKKWQTRKERYRDYFSDFLLSIYLKRKFLDVFSSSLSYAVADIINRLSEVKFFPFSNKYYVYWIFLLPSVFERGSYERKCFTLPLYFFYFFYFIPLNRFLLYNVCSFYAVKNRSVKVDEKIICYPLTLHKSF